MKNKCERCGKHKQVYKNNETNEKICIICTMKMMYKEAGWKDVYVLLKRHIKYKRLMEWKDIIACTLVNIVLAILTIYGVFCSILIIKIELWWLIPLCLVYLALMIYFWKE